MAFNKTPVVRISGLIPTCYLVRGNQVCEPQPQNQPQEALARKFCARGRSRFFRPRQMGHAAKVNFDLEVRFPALYSPECSETYTRRRSWSLGSGDEWLSCRC